MKFQSLEDIHSHLKEIRESLLQLSTIKFLLEKDYELYLVGGATRDWIISGQLSFDLDLEIQNSKSDSVAQLSNEIESELKSLQLKFEKLNFNIFRVFEGEYELELSFPRLETYPSLASGAARKHDDFETQIITHRPILESFHRRDLSINAMAIKLTKNEVSFEDPYAGLSTLLQKEAKHVGDNFNKDPVRFLRMIRFLLRFDLNLSPSLELTCSEFNLLECSDFHFLREYEKSGHSDFLNRFYTYAKKFKIKYPEKWNALKDFSQFRFKDLDEHLFKFWQNNQADEKVLKHCEELLRLKSDVFKKFASLDLSRTLLEAPKYSGLVNLEQLSTEEIQQLKKLKNLIQNLDFIQKYSIPVFDFDWLEQFSLQLKQNRPSKEELLSAPEKLRWALALIKNLSI